MKRVITIALLVIASTSVTWAISLEEFVARLAKMENVKSENYEATPELMKKYPGVETVKMYEFKGNVASLRSLLGSVDKKYEFQHEEKGVDGAASATLLIDRDSNPAMVVSVMRLVNDGWVMVLTGGPDMVEIFTMSAQK